MVTAIASRTHRRIFQAIGTSPQHGTTMKATVCVADIKQQMTALERPDLVASNVPVTVEQSGSRIVWPFHNCAVPGVITGNTFALPFENVVETCFASLTPPSGFPTPWQRFHPPWEDVCEVPWRNDRVGLSRPFIPRHGYGGRDCVNGPSI